MVNSGGARTPRIEVVINPPATRPPGEFLVACDPTEALAIAAGIAPHFQSTVSTYDERKYVPAVYDRVLVAFESPATVTFDDIKDALYWKYGHLGKSGIPATHSDLIGHIHEQWPRIVAAHSSSPADTFYGITAILGSPGSRFVTVAFLTHLLHSGTIPIIDQHNYRATNRLMRMVRPSWRWKAAPSTYRDIDLVRAFIGSVVKAHNQASGHTPISARDMDKFLMMYGKSVKGAAAL